MNAKINDLVEDNLCYLASIRFLCWFDNGHIFFISVCINNNGNTLNVSYIYHDLWIAFGTV